MSNIKSNIDTERYLITDSAIIRSIDQVKKNPGDEAAWAEIFNYLNPRLTKYAAYLVSNSVYFIDGLEHDIVMESWKKIIKNTPVQENTKNYHKWCNSILHNVWIDYVRSQNSRRAINLSENETDEDRIIYKTVDYETVDFKAASSNPMDNPDEKLNFEVRDEIVRTMLMELPEIQQTIFKMKYGLGIKNREIVRRLGISNEEFNSQHSKLKYSIKKSVSEYQDKHDLKLYNIAPFPFAIWMYRSYLASLKPADARTAVHSLLSNAGFKTAGAAGAGSAAESSSASSVSTAGTAVKAGAMKYIIGGTVAMTAIGGGAVYAISNKEYVPKSIWEGVSVVSEWNPEENDYNFALNTEYAYFLNKGVTYEVSSTASYVYVDAILPEGFELPKNDTETTKLFEQKQPLKVYAGDAEDIPEAREKMQEAANDFLEFLHKQGVKMAVIEENMSILTDSSEYPVFNMISAEYLFDTGNCVKITLSDGRYFIFNGLYFDPCLYLMPDGSYEQHCVDNIIYYGFYNSTIYSINKEGNMTIFESDLHSD